MDNNKILLCADSESLIRPELIGLDNVELEKIPWLTALSDAAEIRTFVRSANATYDIWIVASDQVESINLAAALRGDNKNLRIIVIDFDTKNLAKQNFAAVGVTEIWTAQEFQNNFAKRLSAPPETDVKPVEGTFARAEKHSESNDFLKEPTQRAQKDKAFKSSFVMTVLSGSGGVGKTTFASIAACIAQARGFRTVLIDGDSQFGDIYKSVAGGVQLHIDELLDNPSLIEDANLYREEKVPITIVSPKRLETSEKVSGNLNKVVEICSKKFDIVIVDTSTFWADDHIWALENSDCSVFMLDQRASSIRSAERATDLCMRMGIATRSFVYVLNRCSKNAIFSGMDIANIMQGAQVAELKEGETEIEEYLGSGLCSELSSLKNDYVSSIEELLQDVLPASSFFTGNPEWCIPKEQDQKGQFLKKPLGSLFERRSKKRPKQRKRLQESNKSYEREGA